MEKKAYLISCSDHYGHRLFAADAALRASGYDTTYITSDFDHTSKKSFVCTVPGCVQLPAKAYRKNLSFARIASHYFFARRVCRYLDSLAQQPDLIYVLLPPNFLAHFCAGYKRKHPDVKLVFDIFDLWPETFPSGAAKKLLRPVFSVWAWLRDHSLRAADRVVTECDLFAHKLGLDGEQAKTIYLCAQPLAEFAPVELAQDKLELCYLGAINNVIDIDSICDLLRQLTAEKEVVLHIIGKGERQEAFIESAKAAGTRVQFYGAVYDDGKKQAIMAKCHFGLNVMKSSVCVGLSMKSVEYLRHGLPIINNIPADTQALVETEGVGIGLDAHCARKLLGGSREDWLAMRKNVCDVFARCFSCQVIDGQYRALLEDL